MNNPFIGCRPLISRGELSDLVRTSCSRESELRERCKEAHAYYLELSEGKDDVGRMYAMKKAAYKYGLNFQSIDKGYPVLSL